ncbi:AGE family epimerase/isomerase [Afifella marina]|uniref:Mannose or cellobiose epimerase, N-acyl-D-glucosamine 2-epimerase family n=1 Tax=Afifella marina DSM 2698 TaxID=1120955 RepID=A0A1G5ME43_AFIMA|nr:AGE family epimerase/isomerase [Afifella marina]MBK1622569.1 AGE family epimerase/isomerase [Afifella marina DSM 2698]MBK1625564.1 AGE family epimerase/isomerase [Afifella marina]MBK5917387.1 sugar isomerase [Afifella marina]RAI23338.1 sugar isomerase [Afifella marina DSM 2698]SCZ23393.1 Mannose or cellobiose epimerase, N-acyl-D-glucosamine 2-epimerase family [Afifella marina DSM 2698]
MVEPLALFGAEPGNWLVQRQHQAWLRAEGRRLLDFSKPSLVPHGFAALDLDGRLPDKPVAETIVTARMVHSYGLGMLQGLPGCIPLVDHGLASLASGPLRDSENGGWWLREPDAGAPRRKQAYAHAFVALAASTGFIAKRPAAKQLLEEAIDVIETHFWHETEGAMRESFASDWSDEEDYRGANSNMHSLEMCLALADAVNAPKWRERGLRIANRLIHDYARANDYCLPEHFDRNWQVLRDYNRDKPEDDLRPYGTTPGHSLEWSHLLLKLEAALLTHGETPPSWLLEDAIALFETAMHLGWAADERPGIVYTLDWNGRPSVPERAHWVHAEAVTAAATLFKRTGRKLYSEWYQRLWDYIDLAMIDRERGGWLNEVDAEGRDSERIYEGKPDLYHAFQATLTPLLPATPSIAVALAQQVDRFGQE